MSRDISRSASDFVLSIAAYFCSQLVYHYSYPISTDLNGEGHGHYRITIEFEPALKSLFYVQYAALIGAIRFALIPRGQLICLGHEIMTVLGQQLSLSLLGLSYYLLAFPSSTICRYFVSNFNDTFTSFERTLLLLIIVVHLLNIQYVDKAIPILFGFVPIAVVIVSVPNWNVTTMGFMSLCATTFAVVILRDGGYGQTKALRIRYVHWFHVTSILSIYLHVITLINLSHAHTQRLSLYDCFTLNFLSVPLSAPS